MLTMLRRPRMGTLAGLMIAATFAAPLAAQQPAAPTPVPAVEVVATRVPHSPDEIPASVEVITGEQIRLHGALTLRDALSLAAGVAIAPGGDAGPAGSVPEFWGLREFDAFLLVVDDVPWGGAFNPATTAISLRDVERVEVLRGPAPVTYGATSFVGVIHIVHSAASLKARSLSVSGGTFGGGSIGLSMGAPSVLGLDSRLVADLDRDGYKDDRTESLRGHVNWHGSRMKGQTRQYLGADITILQQDPASPHAREGAALSTQTPLDANYNPAGAFVNENRFTFSGGFERPLASGATWSLSAAFTHSAQEMFRGFLTDISNTADNASGFRENIDINDFYGDTHIIWPMKGNMRLMAGADLLAAGGEAEGAVFTYTAPLAATSAPNVPEPTTFDRDAENERMFVGAYGSADWQLGKKLAVNAGARLNLTSEKRGEGDPSTNTRLSGSVGAIYGLWENGLGHARLFANVRETFKPAAFDFGLAENEGILEPETALSYEAGVNALSSTSTLPLVERAFTPAS